ncbi:TIGR03086 family metal-binding protein [Kutzneria sp. NPDC051319]|uniref:TIGR03086 family metal-binding protein n=1 Tax=Kutzneria sp. NPDC051319 TaxID=3155047 RepID=UPI00341A53CB
MHINSLLVQHRTVIQASIDVVSRVTPASLDRPTPCAGWSLSDLLAHMTAQHRGFAAAARGQGSDLTAWQVLPLGSRPVASYTEAALDVLSAFAAPSSAFDLPEFHPVSRFPAAQAISFHLIDYVVHGWDVARSLGLDYTLPPATLDLALPIALSVPNDANRLAPDAPFAPALLVGDAPTPLDQILIALGRSPSWLASVA